MGTATIELTDVAIERGHGSRAKRVIRDLTLQIAPGEIVAVLGASGRGKSTLLHAIAGLLPIASGSISGVTGQPGLVFQDSLLLPWLTVRQNIALAYQFKANYRGADSAEVSARIDHILQRTGLTELQSRLPNELSGGQAQRVAIARAILRNPDVLLLDEPFSALDAVTSSQLHTLLRDGRDTWGTTVILVTHDINSALTIADRVLVLTEAHLVEEIIPEHQLRESHHEQILAALGGTYVI